MTDLQTLTDEINEALEAVRSPLFVRAGKRAVKWFKRYDYSGRVRSGYGISKSEAANYLRSHNLQGLAQ